MLTEHDEGVFADCLQDLEALGPHSPEGAASLDIGAIFGAWPLVQKLIAALKAKDFVAIAVNVRDLLNLFLGSDSNGEIVFHQAATISSAHGQFLKVIGGVLLKLLPLVLGLSQTGGNGDVDDDAA